MIKKNLFKDSGFTLVELIAAFAIVFIALSSLFVGIHYAEKRITRNYHDRQGIMIASGELEWQYYKKTIEKDFDLDGLYKGRAVMGDDFAGNINANVALDFSYGLTSGTVNLNQTTLTVMVSWNEPSDEMKSHYVRMVEDYYDNP